MCFKVTASQKLTLCLCVCLSVTSQSSMKSAKLIIMQPTLHDTDSCFQFQWDYPQWGVPNTGGVDSNCIFSVGREVSDSCCCTAVSICHNDPCWQRCTGRAILQRHQQSSTVQVLFITLTAHLSRRRTELNSTGGLQFSKCKTSLVQLRQCECDEPSVLHICDTTH